jgi:hypothetical protein
MVTEQQMAENKKIAAEIWDIPEAARYAHLFQDPQRAAAEQIGAAIAAAGKPRRGGRHAR